MDKTLFLQFVTQLNLLNIEQMRILKYEITKMEINILSVLSEEELDVLQSVFKNN